MGTRGGVFCVRSCPPRPGRWEITETKSNRADLNGQRVGDTLRCAPSALCLFRGDPDEPTVEHWGGAFVRPEPDKRPTYWHDNPDSAFADQGKRGAKTVNKWRADRLRDWQQRMDRVLARGGDTGRRRRDESNDALGMPRAGCSWIGYATSRDGVAWTRMSKAPVLAAEPGSREALGAQEARALAGTADDLEEELGSGPGAGDVAELVEGEEVVQGVGLPRNW